MAVFFDGERLCVQLNKTIDYKVVLDIAKEAEYSEYLSDVGIYCLPPTRRNAKILYNAGYPFDKSAMHFLKVQKPKRESVESEHRDIDDDIPSSLYPFQKEGVRTLLSNKKNYLIADEMGCLDGETIVTINRRKSSKKMTLEKFYKRFHRLDNYSKYDLKFKDEPFYIRSFNEGYFRLGEVLDVIDSGMKECVRVTTEKGKQLILTPDHEIYLKDGTIQAKDSLGRYVLCNGTEKCPNCGSSNNLITYKYSKFRGYCRTCMYNLRDNWKYKDDDIHEVVQNDGYVYLQGRPLYNYKGRKWTNGVPKHTYVMEKYIGRYLKPGEVVHHIDENKLNNDISNLMLLDDTKAHSKLHGIEKYKNFGFVNPTYEKIVKVENVGARHVYDVKVINHNNFVANHILVHNCGKTVQALTYLKMNKKSLPAVVVCPASLKLNWANEVKKWVGVDSYILNGRTPEYLSDEFVSKYPIWIINYDILGSEDEDERKAELEREIYCKSNGIPYRKKKMKVYGWCDEIARHDFKTIICDEVQNIAEPGTLRSRGVMQICEGNSRKIFLSGTPYETKTSQFFTCLHILDNKLFPNRWFYLMNYCDAKKTRFGWKFDGLSNAEELHEKVSTLMIRRLKKDVLTQLPPKTRIVVPMDVSKKDRTIYDEAERELDEAIENGEKNALSKLAALKQASFEAKKDCVIQWIRDYLEVNDKLVVFVYHKVAFDLLTNTFGKICVGINGGTPNALRQTYVDKFQKDKKVRLFIGQIKATNAGLTLTASNATCFVEFPVSYPQAIQAEDRVHRISQEADAVFAYYLILDNSIDNSIMNVINERSMNINKVMDNIDDSLFSSEEKDFNKAILSKYKEKFK